MYYSPFLYCTNYPYLIIAYTGHNHNFVLYEYHYLIINYKGHYHNIVIIFLIDEPSSPVYYVYMLILCYVNKIYYYHHVFFTLWKLNENKLHVSLLSLITSLSSSSLLDDKNNEKPHIT